MSERIAVILAGGQGTRLHPYTSDTPKPLVSIGDRPILAYLVGQLKRCGFHDLHLAVNHLADKIEAYLGDGSRFGVRVTYHYEETALSTAGPIKLIENLPDSFIVVNGDVLTDLDLNSVLEFHRKHAASLTVASHIRRDVIDYGVLECDENGRVQAFSEKPTIENRVSMGVYAFSRKILSHIPQNRSFGFDQLMLALLDAGEKVLSYDYDGFWLDIGRVEDYEWANRELATIRSLFSD